MPIWRFGRSQERDFAERVLARAVAASRRPGFYGPGRVDDTLGGRFEVLNLHAILVLLRLGKAPDLAVTSQAFADGFFSTIDAGLREHGVSDTAVPRRMHALAAAFYGRLGAYGAALVDDAPVLEQALCRNVFNAEAHRFAANLAIYMRLLSSLHQRNEAAFLLAPEAWPDPVV